MSSYSKVTIVCDWPDCYGRIETHHSKKTDAYAYAAKHGWKRVNGIDLCGAKEQAETYDGNAYSLRGHAGQTDHLPAVKHSRKAFVMLSCTCGWVRRNDYAWQEEGEVARTLVDHYWGKHVREALEAAEGAEET